MTDETREWGGNFARGGQRGFFLVLFSFVDHPDWENRGWGR